MIWPVSVYTSARVRVAKNSFHRKIDEEKSGAVALIYRVRQ